MTRRPLVELAHIGLNVVDFDMMIDFYVRFFEFHVSDQTVRPDGRKIAFMTMDPNVHHQFVIGSGRPEDAEFTPVNQISFRTDSLASVKTYWRAAQEEGLRIDRTLTHGNAWSIYFYDPENNRVEVYADSPWQITQPFVEILDFELPDEEIYRLTEEIVKRQDYCEPFVDWRRKTAAKMGLDDWPIRE